MKTGRPPSWLLEPSGPAVVGQEVAELDEDDRIVLPARLRDGLGWVTGDVLGILEKPGRVRLLPWNASNRVRERRKEIVLRVADVARAAHEDLLLLRAIDDRFCKLTVRPDGRVRLHGALRLHMEAGLRHVVVVRFPDTIEFWSPKYRNNRNEEAASELAELV